MIPSLLTMDKEYESRCQPEAGAKSYIHRSLNDNKTRGSHALATEWRPIGIGAMVAHSPQTKQYRFTEGVSTFARPADTSLQICEACYAELNPGEVAMGNLNGSLPSDACRGWSSGF